MSNVIRIVIADDHATTRQAMKLCLKPVASIKVVGEAQNGREAVELTRALRPRVVVMDIGMPMMDGLEAIRILKRELPQIGIIAMSSSSVYAREALIMGADLFLPKSKAFTQLRDAIVAVTDTPSVWQATPRFG